MDVYFKAVITGLTARTVVLCFFLAVMVGVAAYRLYKSGKFTRSAVVALPFLVSYLYFVLSITILDRTPGEDYTYELELFWSYKEALAGTRQLFMENFWNVALFAPAGLALAILMEKRLWAVVPMAALFSAAIEITQLVTKCGLFEFDDIFHNTLGAALGMLLFRLRTELFFFRPDSFWRLNNRGKIS